MREGQNEIIKKNSSETEKKKEVTNKKMPEPMVRYREYTGVDDEKMTALLKGLKRYDT